MNQIRRGAIILSISLAHSPICFASDFAAMARSLSYAARGAGVERVAVIPFSAIGSGDENDGRVISENLITQMVSMGKVQVVERSLLTKLMSEHLLAQTGAVAPSSMEKLGKILAASGVVTGTFNDTGDGVLINARLINIETGVILAASQRKVNKKWFETSSLGSAGSDNNTIWVPAPQLAVVPPAFPADDDSDMKDAPADNNPALLSSLPGMTEDDASSPEAPTDGSCAAAAARADQMEAGILEVKARYWASRLRDGLSPGIIKINPGAILSDTRLKKTFYDRLEYWYHQDQIPQLSPLETQRLVSMDREAYSIHDQCGGSQTSTQ